MINFGDHYFIVVIVQSKIGPLKHYICEKCKMVYFNSEKIDNKIILICNDYLIKNIIE